MSSVENPRGPESTVGSVVPGWPLWARVITVTVAHFFCAGVSRLLTEQPKMEASFWLPSGLLLGVFLITERREWWAMVVAMLAGEGAFSLLGASSWTLLPWFVAGLGNAGAGLLGAWLVQRWVAARPTLASVRELVGLVGLGGAVSLAVTATVGAAVVHRSGGADYGAVWSSWYFSDLLGVILLTPLILVWHGRVGALLQWTWSPRRTEAMAMVAGLCGCIVGVVVYRWVPGPGLRYLVLPFVIWAAIRFGPRGVTVISLVVALLTGWFALAGYGEGMSSLATAHERNAQLQLALSFVGFFGLIPAIVIEAHRRTEAELREQRNFLKAIFDSEPECVKVLGPEGALGQMNRAGLALLEVDDLAEAQAIGVANFVVPEFREQFADMNRRAFAGERGTLQFQLQGKKGTLRWLETHTTALRDGEGRVSGVLAVTRDVTERKEAESLRRKSEEQLRLIFDAVADGVVVQDRELRIIRCNMAAERILGLTADQMAGRTSLDPRWRAVHEDGRPFPVTDHPAAVALRTGRSVRDVVMGVHQPDGSLTWISTNAEPLRDGVSDELIVVSSFSDITARRALQEQVRQAQKMEVVGQLAGGVAHDFNNILTAMMLNLQLVRMDGRVPAEVREPLDEVEAMTKRAARLTEQLLLFARRRVMRTECYDFNTGIAHVLTLLRRLLGEPVAINLRLAPEALWVNADSGMLDQVVMNLCVNARDAMPAGGVLTLETGAVHFTAEEISAGRHPEARAGRFACLRVSDTGTGMPPEVLTHLFEPFFTTKEVGKGTGLGLATVHGIVHQHHGWIEVESTLGQGSTFRLYLPISPRDATASPAVPRTEVAPGRGTILLVEDEPAVRLVTAAMLRRLGYHVLEAGHGPEALGVWQQHGAGVDLLVADMVMPHGMTGLELAEAFRRAKPSLGIIIVSGYAEEIVKGEAGLKEGFTFVAKPYEFAVLAGVIQQTLARS